MIQSRGKRKEGEDNHGFGGVKANLLIKENSEAGQKKMKIREKV